MSSMVLGLLVVVFLSTLMGWFFSHSKKAEKPVKVMLFVLYFWLSAFAQLILVALLYHFGLFEL